MRYIFLFIVSFITFFSIAQDNINWTDEYRLRVDDFQSAVPANEKNTIKGLTNAVIEVNYKQNGPAVDVSVDCFFRKSGSWIRNTENLAYVLQHEQGHFDIAEIYARLIRKKLKSTKLSKTKGGAQIQKVWKKLYEQYFEMQKKYDKATSHSIKEKEQQEWIEKIANELKKLGAYKNPAFVMQFK